MIMCEAVLAMTVDKGNIPCFPLARALFGIFNRYDMALSAFFFHRTTERLFPSCLQTWLGSFSKGVQLTW